MATTADHMAARSDPDLLARFVARAEQLGVEKASDWVQARMGSLVTQAVDGTQKVTDVYAYAANVRRGYIEATPPRPGENLGAVTDSHLETAIQALYNAENPTPEGEN